MWWKKVDFHNYFLAAGILSVLSIVGALITRSFLPPLIPLFYGKPTGAEQLAPTWFIFIIPGISILITVTNLFVNKSAEDKFIKKILAITSLVISLMATITVVKIIMLVGFF